jgi:hypothetical protein
MKILIHFLIILIVLFGFAAAAFADTNYNVGYIPPWLVSQSGAYWNVDKTDADTYHYFGVPAAATSEWMAYLNTEDEFQFTADLVPSATGSYDLGTSTVFWNNLYVNNVNFYSETVQDLVITNSVDMDSAKTDGTVIDIDLTGDMAVGVPLIRITSPTNLTADSYTMVIEQTHASPSATVLGLVAAGAGAEPLKTGSVLGTWNFTVDRAGYAYSGIDDTEYGIFTAYGQTTGSTIGGIARFHTAADHDGTIQYYQIATVSDDLYIGPDTDTDVLTMLAGSGLAITAGNLDVEGQGIFGANNDIVISDGAIISADRGTNDNLHVRAKGTGDVTFNYNQGDQVDFYGGDTSIDLSVTSSGDIIIGGDLALGDATTLNISGDTVTVVKSFHLVNAEHAIPDDLSTINGGQDGMILVLMNATPDIVTIKDGVGNITTAGDFAMTMNQDTITLIYDAGNTEWYELSRSDN